LVDVPELRHVGRVVGDDVSLVFEHVIVYHPGKALEFVVGLGDVNLVFVDDGGAGCGATDFVVLTSSFTYFSLFKVYTFDRAVFS
jgi:hypothetical protein